MWGLHTINPENIKEIYKVYEEHDKKYILKDGTLTPVTTSKDVIKVGTKKGIVVNIDTVPLTYVNWTCVNCDPSNFLRAYDTFLKEKAISFSAIPTFLQMKNAMDTIQQLEKDIVKSSVSIEEFHPSNNILHPGSHPFEFSTYPIQEVVNAYNLLHMLSNHINLKANQEKISPILRYKRWLYRTAMENWKKILVKEGAHKLKNGYYQIKDKTLIVGNPLDSDTLNNALSYGCLFIRKINKHSFINNYSEQLFNLSMYIPDKYETMKKGDVPLRSIK
jgi:hypothetical protein